MRSVYNLVLFFILSVPAFSQTRERLKEKSFSPGKFEEFPVEIKKSKKDLPVTVQFNEARFIDCRPDTTKVGFALVGGNNIEYHRIILPKSAGQYLTQKASLFCSPVDSAEGKIIFFIKRLWVNEAIVEPTDFGRGLLVGSIDYFSYCYLDVDCYRMEQDSCTYLGNIDTVYSIRKWIANAADDLLKKTLVQTLVKGDSLFMNPFKTSDRFALQDLKNKYKVELDQPVIANKHFVPGVFLSFQDFLDTKTVYPDYKIVNDKKGEHLRVQGIPDSVLNEAWGYFDGKDLHMHINSSFFRMVPVDHTYDVLGPRTITKVFNTVGIIVASAINTFIAGLASGGFTLMALGSTQKIMKEFVPYQLDIRNGLLY